MDSPIGHFESTRKQPRAMMTTNGETEWRDGTGPLSWACSGVLFTHDFFIFSKLTTIPFQMCCGKHLLTGITRWNFERGSALARLRRNARRRMRRIRRSSREYAKACPSLVASHSSRTSLSLSLSVICASIMLVTIILGGRNQTFGSRRHGPIIGRTSVTLDEHVEWRSKSAHHTTLQQV